MLVHKLLQGGANPNVMDRRGMTCMHLSIKHRNIAILRKLISNSKVKLDLNAKNYEGKQCTYAQFIPVSKGNTLVTLAIYFINTFVCAYTGLRRGHIHIFQTGRPGYHRIPKPQYKM